MTRLFAATVALALAALPGCDDPCPAYCEDACLCAGNATTGCADSCLDTLSAYEGEFRAAECSDRAEALLDTCPELAP